jgi:uncharacterized membrane protein YccC
MYCRNCGAKIADNAEFCPVCGRYVTGLDRERGPADQNRKEPDRISVPSGNVETERLKDQARPEKTRMRGFAIASLALGVIGLFWFMLFIPSAAAVVFGVIVLLDCREHPDRNKNRGFAITGTVLGAITAVVGILFYVFLGPEFLASLQSYFAGLERSYAMTGVILRAV